MIKVIKAISIDSGEPPFEHFWDIPDCVQILRDNLNGDVINTEFLFDDSNCFSNLPTNSTGGYIELTVIGADGCEQTFEINIQNPCLSFQTSTPNLFVGGTDPFVIRAVPVGGAEPYQFTWFYDELLFNPLGNTPQPGEPVQNQNEILLELSDVSLIGTNSSTVTCVIKDGNDCQITVDTQVDFDYPTAQDITKSAYCIASADSVVQTTGPFYLPVESTGVDIDWTTLEVWEDGTANQNDYTITNYEDGRISIELDYDQDIVFGYRVKDEEGFTTDIGTILVEPLSCDDVAPISIMSLCTQLDCENFEVGSIYRFNLEEYVISANEINWDTFNLIPLSGQVANEQDTNQYGTFTVGVNSNNALIRFTNDHYLEITVFETTPFLEQVAFSVEDNFGNKVTNYEHPYTFNLFCDSLPYAVDDYICTSCDEAVTYNVLSNDLPDGQVPFDPATLGVTNTPDPGTEGSVTVNNSTGEITFTPVSGFSGSVTFDYSVDDANGVTISGQVTVDAYCIGTISYSNAQGNGSGSQGDPYTLTEGTAGNLDIDPHVSGIDSNTRVYFAGFNSSAQTPTYSGDFALDGGATETFDPGEILYDGLVTDIDFSDSDPGHYIFELRYGEGDCKDIEYFYVEITTAP